MLALALALVIAVPASAQDAEALITEGVALREEGRDEEALARFEEAQRIAPSARALAQIALAEQALGRSVAAEGHLAAALEDGADRFVARNRPHLEQALAEIRSMIGELSITGGVDGAAVTIGGALRGTLPLLAPIRLDHGTAHVEIAAAGHEPFAADVEIPAGGSATLDVALVAVAATEPLHEVIAPPEEPASPPPEWMEPTGIALSATGAVGAMIGIGLAIVREDHAQARLTCSDVDPACRDRYQAAVDAEAGAIAASVIGWTLAAGGAVILVLWAIGLPSSPPQRSVACAPGVLSIGCAGSF